METNPYAPPKAPVADVVPRGLKRRSVLLVIIFLIVTLGLYYPIWFLRRRAALNSLDSQKKLQLWPFVIYGVAFVLAFVVSFVAAFRGITIDPNLETLLRIVNLAVGILMLVQAFVVRHILEDHLAGPDGDASSSLFVERITLSGVMTFFFQIIYLQWAINRYIADRPATGG